MVTPNSVFVFQNLLLSSAFYPHTSVLGGTVLKWITWKPDHNKQLNLATRMTEHLLITNLSTFSSTLLKTLR